MDNKEVKENIDSSKRHTLYIILFGLFIIVSVLSMIFLSVGALNVDTQAGKLFGAAGFFAALGCKNTIKEAAYHFSWAKLAEILSVYMSGLLGCYLAVKLGIQGILVAIAGIGIGVVICVLLFFFIHFIFKKEDKTNTLSNNNQMPSNEPDISISTDNIEPKTEDVSIKEGDNSKKDVKKEDSQEDSNVNDNANFYEEDHSIEQLKINKDDESADVLEYNSVQQTANLQDLDTSKAQEAESNILNSQKKEVKEQNITKIKKETTKKHIFKKHKKLIIALGCSFIALILCGIVAYSHFSPPIKYKQAREYIRNGNVAKGEAMLKSLANSGYAEAARRLGGYYWNGDTMKQNIKESLKYLKIAADLNDTLGTWGYGRLCAEDGKIKEGIKYLTKAIDMGLHEFDVNQDLAEIYGNNPFYGHNNPYYNLDKSYKYALEMPDSISDKYLYVGNYYADRDSYSESQTQQDYEKAFYWFKKGAEKGNIYCINNLGWMYFYGNGVHPDKNRALSYFRKALEIDEYNDYANYHIGLIMLQIYHNIEAAKKYLKVAADNGNEDAQAELAKLEM